MHLVGIHHYERDYLSLKFFNYLSAATLNEIAISHYDPLFPPDPALPAVCLERLLGFLELLGFAVRSQVQLLLLLLESVFEAHSVIRAKIFLL